MNGLDARAKLLKNFPSSDRTICHCDAHHVRYWRHARKTDYGNLVNSQYDLTAHRLRSKPAA